jgi:hypothetical protein
LPILNENRMKIEKLNPTVDKKVLVLLAGVMWCSVGIMLICFAITWLRRYNESGVFLFYMAGFLAAMPIHHFGFLKLADKNLNRLLPDMEKRSVFTFMTWRSYFIVLIMVSLGIALRHSPIPKQYLSILYNGIGLALFLSGLRYMRYYIKLVRNPQGGVEKEHFNRRER